MELAKFGYSKALVLCTPRRAAEARSLVAPLASRVIGYFQDAEMHVPIGTVKEACDEVRRTSADCTIAIGGGSTIGLGKAIALETGLPLIAVPTTYSGSEMTPIFGITDAGKKRTGRDPRVLPSLVIYDPTLTIGLPIHTSAVSGMNAVAHCVEALYARESNPISNLMAVEGISALATGLPRIAIDPRDIHARTDAFRGSWLAGSVLGMAGMALHHKLCHILGGAFNLPHAETHTAVLPHVVAYNSDAAPAAIAKVASALGTEHVAPALFDLAHALGAEMSLRNFGLNESDIERVTGFVFESPYYNPKPVTTDAVHRILNAALNGRRPH